VKLLKNGGDVDILEDILRVVFKLCRREGTDQPLQTQERVVDNKPVAAESETAENNATQTEIKAKKPIVLMDWIEKLSTLDKFELMLRFADTELISAVRMYVSSQTGFIACKGIFSA
jgi:hypothetical protein